MKKERDSYLKYFGKAVKSLRRGKGISQEELAEIAGIDRSYLGGIERGEHNLSLVNIIKISNALGINVGSLFIYIDKYLED